LAIGYQLDVGSERGGKLSEALRAAMSGDMPSPGDNVNDDELNEDEAEFIGVFLKKFKSVFANSSGEMSTTSVLKTAMESGLLDDMDNWFGTKKGNIDPMKIVRALQLQLVQGIVRS
jgi:hypothetical protein